MDNPNRGVGVAIVLWLFASLSQAAINSWTPLGPDGGRVTKLQFSSASQTLFATANNGVYRSQDDGQHWHLMYDRFFNGPSDIVVDPVDASHVYVASPDAPGFYVSTDGGTTFAPSLKFPAGQAGGHLAISPDGMTLCMVVLDSHIFCSTDRAQTWNLRGRVTTYSSSLPLNLVMDPTDRNTMYVSTTTSGTSDDILATHDGGATWASIRSVNPQLGYVQQIAINPLIPSQLWAAENDGAWVSNDAGANWTRVIAEAVFAIAVDPSNASIVYAGLPYGGVYRSPDGGTTWTDVTGNISRQQISTVAVNPTQSAQVFVGGLSGIAVSTSSGNQWTTQQTGLNATMVTGLVADATAGRIYVNVSTNGLFYTTSSTVPAVPIPNNAGLLFFVNAGLPFNVSAMTAGAGTLWASNLPWVDRSTDGGTSWTSSQFRISGPNQFFAMASPAGSTSILLGAGDKGLYRTDDDGATWGIITAGISADNTVSRLLTAPSDSIVAYASVDLAATGPGAPTPMGIFRSTDAGMTWTPPASSASVSPTVLLAIDPVNSAVIYGNTQATFEKSADGGATWTVLPWSAAGDGGVMAMAIDPAHPQVLWVSGGVRIARSVDGGATWETIHDVGSLPVWAPVAMLVDPKNPGTVLLGTTKAGVQAFTAAPDLAVTVTPPADPIPVGAGSSYTYTVSNLGPFDSSGAHLNVTLPAGIQSMSASSSSGTCSVSGTTAICSLGILRVNTHANVTVIVTPSTVGSLTASATLSGDQPDSAMTNNQVSSTSTVAVIADVSVTVSGNSTAIVGGAVSYTLTAGNAGPSVPDSTQLTYQLASGLTPGTVTATGASCTSGSGGLITCTIANLAVGKSASVTVNATAATAGSQSSTANITSSALTDPVSGNNAATVTTSVSAPAASGGGGGSMGWLALVSLATLLLARCTRALSGQHAARRSTSRSQMRSTGF